MNQYFPIAEFIYSSIKNKQCTVSLDQNFVFVQIFFTIQYIQNKIGIVHVAQTVG